MWQNDIYTLFIKENFYINNILFFFGKRLSYKNLCIIKCKLRKMVKNDKSKSINFNRIVSKNSNEDVKFLPLYVFKVVR